MTTLGTLCLAAAITGFSGSMNELTFSDLLQPRYAQREISQVFRFRVAVETAVMLVLLLFTPRLIESIGIQNAIALSGIVWVVAGLIGLLFFEKSTRS